jgi:hypothetical protein
MRMSLKTGGACDIRCVVLAACLATCACLLLTPSAFASFGLKSVSAVARNRDGSVALQAGSHPYEYVLSFEMNEDSSGALEGTLRDLIVELPPGLVGDPQALPRCGAAFEGEEPHCPGNTQIGVTTIKLVGLSPVENPLYNLTPALGVPASLGFSLNGATSLQEASLRSGGDYGVSVSDITIPTSKKIQSISETIWGVPADAGHDPQRVCRENSHKVEGCPSGIAAVPFLTLPTSCTGPLTTTVKVDSLEEPGVFHELSAGSLNEGGAPAGLHGCQSLPFQPAITAQPETTASDSPTGLHVDLHLPQNENSEGLATANLKDTVVTLPPGLVLNPSAADGLDGCTPAQVDLHGAGAAECPDASKIGTAEIQTPLLDHPVTGGVYLATQGDNPFGSLLALYITVDDPLSGVVVKLAGEVEPDPVTGQLKTTFLNNPQLPFEDLNLDLPGGPRAPLTTPSSCGTYTTTSVLTPWTTPEGASVESSDAFQINSGANGAGCITSEAQEPHAPSFEAGTTTPLAGSYSPFVLKLGRENGSQHLSAINVTLPPGLTGKLAGVTECSDAQLEQAAGRNQPGEGATELASPSCPQSSEVGGVTVGAGSGSPVLVGGHAYLAGPYKGAPLSLAIITPAVAGPFDLGTVVVRSALFIDPATAQVTVKSDPLPTILQGIPLDIRSVAIAIDRPQFVLNPTSCEPMSVTGEAISTQNQTAGLSNRFQVGGCQGLAFKPALTTSTVGKASKADGASLTVKVSQQPGEANIHKVELTIPTELPSRLTTLQQACTEAQFNANPAGCPAGAFIGTATAKTPILGVPLTGPAILVSHGGASFPDVEFVLQANERGGTIRIDLDGKTDIKKGVTYSRFETVPDAPISSFETVLPEGPHSILGVNLPQSANYSLCGQKLSIATTITGQNGAQVRQSTPVAVEGCSTTLSFTHSVKKRTVTLSIYAPAAGKITAGGNGLATVTKTAKGQEKLTITLKQKKAGKQTARVKVGFAPKKGKKQSKTVTVSFKK